MLTPATWLLALAALLVGAPAARAQDRPVDPQIVDGTEQRRLDEARARWRDRGFRSYRFRVARGCFCPAEIQEPRVIVVRRGRPRGAPDHLRPAATVPRLLRIVQRAIDGRVSSLDVRYGRRGVPRSIAIDPRLRLSDDEDFYGVDRLRRG
jgi:Family of unknown function (DUF6174)